VVCFDDNMRLGIASVLGAALWGLASSSPTGREKRQSATNACRQIGQGQVAGTRLFKPSLALACLNAIAVDKDRDMQYID
jgi:hypothetical protein